MGGEWLNKRLETVQSGFGVVNFCAGRMVRHSRRLIIRLTGDFTRHAYGLLIGMRDGAYWLLAADP